MKTLIKKAEEMLPKENNANKKDGWGDHEYGTLSGYDLAIRDSKEALPAIFAMWEEDLRENKLEQLAELEHEQWEEWSKNIASNENISQDRIDRWRKLWIPYKDLSENAKDQDRTYARKVLNLLSTNPNKEDENTKT